MSIAALIRGMAAAGAPPEAIALAVEAIEAANSADRARKDAVRDKKRRQREASRDMGGTVPGQSQDNVGTVSGQTPSPSSSPDPSNNPTPVPPPAKPAHAREAFPRPDWADTQVWTDFLANRRRKGLANTPTAHRKLLNDIERLADTAWPPPRLLEAAAAKGWGALYPSIKDDDDGRPRNGHPAMAENHRPASRGRGRTIDGALDFIADIERGHPH